MKQTSQKLLNILTSENKSQYAKIRALEKLSGISDISSLGYDSKINNTPSAPSLKLIGNIMKGLEEAGTSPTEEGGKWKELKVNLLNKNKTKNPSLFSLLGESPSGFKKYFRNAEIGRTDSQAKREQSKVAMPGSAKIMIQKYLKIKNG